MPFTHAKPSVNRPLYSPNSAILRLLLVLFIAGATIIYELFRSLKDRLANGHADSEASLVALSSDESAVKSF